MPILVELMHQQWDQVMKVNQRQVEILLFAFVGMCYNEIILPVAPVAQVQPSH